MNSSNLHRWGNNNPRVFEFIYDLDCSRKLTIFFSGLLTEEEIPTALYMLRMISQKSLKSKFPQMKFWKFVFSAMVRLMLGYAFLFNMFIIIVQSDAVIDIFYDLLALQVCSSWNIFVQDVFYFYLILFLRLFISWNSLQFFDIAVRPAARWHCISTEQKGGFRRQAITGSEQEMFPRRIPTTTLFGEVEENRHVP